jgi:hypothetical protein
MMDVIKSVLTIVIIFGLLFYYFNHIDMGGGKLGDFMRDVNTTMEINKANQK